MDYVWMVGVLLVMGGLWYVAYRMEPHWVARDGSRFMCGSQEITDGELEGHPRETQVAFLGDGTLHVTHKRMMRRHRSVWNLVGKSDNPPKKMEIYLAQERVDGTNTTNMLALRIPKKSKCVALLDAQLERSGVKPATVRSESPETS